MKKYFFFSGEPGCTRFEIKEYSDHDQMIEAVRKYHESNERLPVVFFGQRLEFEPAEIVKSWKIKE